jgi:hypothetical protein
MNKLLLSALVSIIAFCFSVSAQNSNRYSSTRLDNLANELKRQTVDLADRASEDFRRGNSKSRAEIESAFLAQQLDAGAGFFQLMVRDNRSASELRDAASILSDLARRAPNYGTNGNLWRNAQNAVRDINRELGGNYGGGNGGNGGNDSDDNQRTGRVTWRGTVDRELNLVIRSQDIEERVLSGQAYNNGRFNFTSPLPSRRVTVDAVKKSGRGTVRVLQQPNRSNDFTAVVQIFDEGGGARDYEVEISWR